MVGTTHWRVNRLDARRAQQRAKKIQLKQAEQEWRRIYGTIVHYWLMELWSIWSLGDKVANHGLWSFGCIGFRMIHDVWWTISFVDLFRFCNHRGNSAAHWRREILARNWKWCKCIMFSMLAIIIWFLYNIVFHIFIFSHINMYILFVTPRRQEIKLSTVNSQVTLFIPN